VAPYEIEVREDTLVQRSALPQAQPRGLNEAALTAEYKLFLIRAEAMPETLPV
jgi:hypothetical protein